jgi:protein required for attachment to host cells
MKAGKRLWVVVSDGARARFFAPGYEERGFKPTGPGELSSEVVHATISGVRHTIEPKHDYHRLEKRKFAHMVAEALDRAHAERAFDQLLLVVPRRSLGELRIVLSEQVKASIKEIIAKDLTANSNEELWKKLAPAVGRLSAAVV